MRGSNARLAAFLLLPIAFSATAYNRDGSPTATITQEQRVAVVAHFTAPGRVPEPFTKTAAEIAPVASTALQMVMCGATWNGQLRELIGSAHLRQPVVIKPHPFDRAQYHPKDACMDVEEVSEWSMPANNAIRFTVKFNSPHSGEVTRIAYEMTRNTQGEWLFNRMQPKF